MSLVVDGVTLTDIVIDGVAMDRVYVDGVMVYDKWARQRVSFPTLPGVYTEKYTAKYNGVDAPILASSSSYVEINIPVIYDISKLEIIAHTRHTYYTTVNEYTDITNIVGYAARDALGNIYSTCSTLWNNNSTVIWVAGVTSTIRVGGEICTTHYAFSDKDNYNTSYGFYLIKNSSGTQLKNITRRTIENITTREVPNYTYAQQVITNISNIVKV